MDNMDNLEDLLNRISNNKIGIYFFFSLAMWANIARLLFFEAEDNDLHIFISVVSDTLYFIFLLTCIILILFHYQNINLNESKRAILLKLIE